MPLDTEQNREQEPSMLDKFDNYFANLALLFDGHLSVEEITTFIDAHCPDKDPFTLTAYIISLLNQSLIEEIRDARRVVPLGGTLDEVLLKAAETTNVMQPDQAAKLEELFLSLPIEYWQCDKTDPAYLEAAVHFSEQL